jgi:hypothetical protein
LSTFQKVIFYQFFFNEFVLPIKISFVTHFSEKLKKKFKINQITILGGGEGRGGGRK